MSALCLLSLFACGEDDGRIRMRLAGDADFLKVNSRASWAQTFAVEVASLRGF